MRKRRVIIFDDEVFILNMLRDFFTLRGYEVFPYKDPTVICPVYGKGGDLCMKFYPCADVLITDFNMPGVNGVELLMHQARKQCKLDVRNKAVISGYIDEAGRKAIAELGCAFFQKPFTLFRLDEWLAECERRTDPAQPLACRRREARYDAGKGVRYALHSRDEYHPGVVVNVSDSGLCIRSSKQLVHDQRLRIVLEGATAVQQATVRWVRQAGESGYLAGLRYC